MLKRLSCLPIHMKNSTEILIECNSDLNLRVLELKSYIVE